MKFIQLALALFILGLSTLPCADSYGQSDHEESITHIETINGSHTDSCSLFCSCHCCHTHLVVANALSNEDINHPLDNYLAYYQREAGEFIYPVFQPPKV